MTFVHGFGVFGTPGVTLGPTVRSGVLVALGATLVAVRVGVFGTRVFVGGTGVSVGSGVAVKVGVSSGHVANGTVSSPVDRPTM